MTDNVLKKEWNAVSSKKPKVVTMDGKTCMDMVSTDYIRISPPPGYPLLGQYYTQFYIWLPRETDNGWRTLYRDNHDHLTLVHNGKKDLGVYGNRGGGFRDSGYDITVKWQVLIATSEGDSATSNMGTTTFYVNDESDQAKMVGTSDRVASGTSLYQVGWGGQAPGCLIDAGLLNQKLTDTEIQELMTLLITKMTNVKAPPSSPALP